MKSETLRFCVGTVQPKSINRKYKAQTEVEIPPRPTIKCDDDEIRNCNLTSKARKKKASITQEEESGTDEETRHGGEGYREHIDHVFFDLQVQSIKESHSLSKHIVSFILSRRDCAPAASVSWPSAIPTHSFRQDGFGSTWVLRMPSGTKRFLQSGPPMDCSGGK